MLGVNEVAFVGTEEAGQLLGEAGQWSRAQDGPNKGPGVYVTVITLSTQIGDLLNHNRPVRGHVKHARLKVFHGSWNRAEFSGYKVVFVPFSNGKPSGNPEDFLTGFIANDKDVYGRPVGVTTLPDGSVLVADDAGNRIWRVAAQ